MASCDRTKAQRVQAKLRACAHRENVANDSADTSRGALERLDGARMIVALDLERDRPAIANIHHAGIFFAGFDQNVWTGGGKFLQLSSRIFVRAVFTPHDRENAQLGKVRLATEDFFDPLELFRSEAVPLDEFGRNNWIGGWRFVGHWHATLLSSPEALNHATGNNSNIAVLALVKAIDANGASVQSLSHELGVTLTINRRG